jgi:hypothetical protein
MKKTKTALPACVAAVLLTGALAHALPAESRYGTRERPLTGQRYQTMRALARYLDDTAQGALEGAADEVRSGTSSDARFLSSVRAFGRGAGDFRRRIDNYPAIPFEVSPPVAELAKEAGQLSERIRAAYALESTYGEWRAVREVLQQMTLLLAGRDVEVPALHVAPVLSGPRLEAVRVLARDLDISAARAYETAKREVAGYRLRGPQFLAELQYFATRSRELRTRVEAGDLDHRPIGPMVDRLLAEARGADRQMRDALVFTEVWDDSGRTITLLERMTSMLRS